MLVSDFGQTISDLLFFCPRYRYYGTIFHEQAVTAIMDPTSYPAAIDKVRLMTTDKAVG